MKYPLEITLRDIIESLENAHKWAGYTALPSEVRAAAVERAIFIAGEAATRIREYHDGFYRLHAVGLKLERLIGMRNHLAHGYETIAQEILYEVATVDGPELLRKLVKIMNELGIAQGNPTPDSEE